MNIHKPGDYFVIPIGICKQVVHQKLFRAFQVWICMKMISSGILHSKVAKPSIALQLEVTVRTVEMQLARLEALGWIKRHDGKIYLRSFSYVCTIYQEEENSGVVFNPDNIKNLKPFIIGSVLGYVINAIRMKRMRERMRLESRNKGRDIPNKPSALHYVPLANSIVASICNCSMSTASQFKGLAYKYGYIDVRPANRMLKIPVDEYWRYKKHAPESHVKHVFIVNNAVVEREPDLVISYLKFKYRRQRKKAIYKLGAGGSLFEKTFCGQQENNDAAE